MFIFGITDYWYWGQGLGKCCCRGGYVGIDAAYELYQYVNQFPRYPMSCYTDIETTIDIHPWDAPQQSGNPFGYLPYLLFDHGGDTFPEPVECLTPDAMNYYLDGLKSVGDYFKPHNKELIYYYCYYTETVSNYSWAHIHEAHFTYGYCVGVPFPPIVIN